MRSTVLLRAARGAFAALVLIVPFAVAEAGEGKRVPIYSSHPTAAGASASSTPIPTAQWFRLQNQRPAAGTTAASVSPVISATFSDKVNASTVTVIVDGRDVTKVARVSTDAFAVAVPFALATGRRTVSVIGMTIGGQQFSQSWSFYVRAVAAANR
jgi:hypothetical protein